MRSRLGTRSLLGGLLASLLAAAVAPAQERPPAPSGRTDPADTLLLTLEEAVRLSLAGNPELQARRQELGAAGGRLRQAKVLPFNPEFSIESERVGGGRTLETYTGEISQELEWAGQRGLRVRAARHDLTRAEEGVRDAERLTRAEAARAFYAALAAEHRVGVAEEIRELNERLLAAVSDLLEAGAVSTLEANLVRIESGRAQARVLTERRNAESARVELRRVLGLPESRPVRLVPDVPPAPDPEGLDVDSLVVLALSRRPDLRAAEAGVEGTRALLGLARREAIPNLRLSVPFDRPGRGESRRVGVGIGLSIPLWNRNQGVAEELRAEVARRRFERAAVERTVRAEVMDALQRYRSASREEALAAEVILDPARTNQELLEEAFRAGKIALPTLLLLRNQLLEAELDYWDSWLERRLELVRLEAVIAAPIPNP